jgi:membrane protease subunit (stomatin/prohibitin family)
MAFNRTVITALDNSGNDVLGTKNIAYRIHNNQSIVDGSLLTVESNHFCVLKSRGAVLNVYDTGQYAVATSDKPIVGSIVSSFWGGSPWVYEVLYINRAKLLVRNEGIATTEEMAEVSYVVDYYIHVDTKEDALALVTHLPFNGQVINTAEVAEYAGPAIEQAVNQIIQVTKLENINDQIATLLETVKAHLAEFLKVYGIHLNDLKVLVLPKDEKIREIIALRALGVPDHKLGDYYLALRMAEKGLWSAPNAAAGVGASIGGNPMVTVPGATSDKG